MREHVEYGGSTALATVRYSVNGVGRVSKFANVLIPASISTNPGLEGDRVPNCPNWPAFCKPVYIFRILRMDP